jgi:hypothetical protein
MLCAWNGEHYLFKQDCFEYLFCFFSSKQLTQPAQPVQPAKLAAIQQQSAATSNNNKEETGSHKEGSSGSSPRSEGIMHPINHASSFLS